MIVQSLGLLSVVLEFSWSVLEICLLIGTDPLCSEQKQLPGLKSALDFASCLV